MTQTDIHIRISGFIYKPANRKLFDKALDVVSAYTGIEQSKILSPSRKHQLVIARCVLVTLCKGAEKKFGDDELAKFLSRDRTSIIHIRNVFFDFYDTDSNFCQRWEEMKTNFSNMLSLSVQLPNRPNYKKNYGRNKKVISILLAKSIAR